MPPQGPHWLLGLNVSTANTVLHVAIKWLLAQDASLSPRWGLPPGGLAPLCPVKEVTVSSPLLRLSKSCLTLRKPPAFSHSWRPSNLSPAEPSSGVQAARTSGLPGGSRAHCPHEVTVSAVQRSGWSPPASLLPFPAPLSTQGRLPTPSCPPPAVAKLCHAHSQRAGVCPLPQVPQHRPADTFSPCGPPRHRLSGISGEQRLPAESFSGSPRPWAWGRMAHVPGRRLSSGLPTSLFSSRPPQPRALLLPALRSRPLPSIPS